MHISKLYGTEPEESAAHGLFTNRQHKNFIANHDIFLSKGILSIHKIYIFATKAPTVEWSPTLLIERTISEVTHVLKNVIWTIEKTCSSWTT